VGQAGKHIKPKFFFSFGISRRYSTYSRIGRSGFIIAINKNPQANYDENGGYRNRC